MCNRIFGQMTGEKKGDQKEPCGFFGFLNKLKRLDSQRAFTFAKHFLAVMIHLLEITDTGPNSPNIFENKGSKYLLSYPKYISKVSVDKVF